MLEKQKTIAKKISLKGLGLQTKKNITITFNPANEYTGFIFIRTDLINNPNIKANIHFFNEKEIKNINLEKDGVEIKGIDHVLAALIGMDLDNVLIELDSIEPPLMDGSAKNFIEALEKAGIIEQNKNRDYYCIDKIVSYTDEKNKGEIIAFPSSNSEIIIMTEFGNNNQNAYLKNINDFKYEIADARDFYIEKKLKFFTEKKIFNKKKENIENIDNIPIIKNDLIFRYPNEIARHELLDLLGYLSLLGKKLKAKIIAKNPLGLIKKEFFKKLYTYIKKNKKRKILKLDIYKKAILDIQDIIKILPHKPPFLLLDKILEISDHHIIGIKNVTMNEHFFIGHFPNEPIMPGVLQIEAMAQVGGVFVLNGIKDTKSYSTYFLKIDKARFKKKVVPGDILVLKMDLLEPIKRGIVKMHGYGFVNENIVVEAEVMAKIVKNK